MVEKCPVSLTVGNREKIYDGKIFNVQDSKLTFSSGELVDGHSLIVRYSARQNGINVNAVDAGVYSLVAHECYIVDKIGLDVSDCYDIKIKPGTLTITGIIYPALISFFTLSLFPAFCYWLFGFEFSYLRC